MKTKTRWFIQSVSGLLHTGTGLCLTLDAVFARSAGGGWFWYGTGSLILFQAGLCFLIDALRFRLR
jgi:hypothetical protein